MLSKRPFLHVLVVAISASLVTAEDDNAAAAAPQCSEATTPIHPQCTCKDSPSKFCFRCTIKDYGIFQHPTDCHRYVQCRNGQSIDVPCGPFQIFDPRLGFCDLQMKVKCMCPCPDRSCFRVKLSMDCIQNRILAGFFNKLNALNC